MRILELFLAVCLILLSSHVLVADDSFLELSPAMIEEAIQYGATTKYKMNEFGGYDLGLNKFSLGDKTGYMDLLTPFARVASLSLKMKNSGKKVSLEEAQERTRKPTELRVFLYVKKADLKDPIRCVIKTNDGELDISGMVMEFSMCGDKPDDCVRALAYLLPTNDLKGEKTFQIVLTGEKLGKKSVEIKADQIK